MTTEHFNPVPLDTKAELARAMQRPGFKAAWDGLEEEYAALNALLEARKQAGLTQEEVAARMGTTKSAVSRLEASLRTDKHSPSFATLRKYAHARAMPRPHITPEQGTMRTLPSELDGRRVGDEFPRRNQA